MIDGATLDVVLGSELIVGEVVGAAVETVTVMEAMPYPSAVELVAIVHPVPAAYMARSPSQLKELPGSPVYRASTIWAYTLLPTIVNRKDIIFTKLVSRTYKMYDWDVVVCGSDCNEQIPSGGSAWEIVMAVPPSSELT